MSDLVKNKWISCRYVNKTSNPHIVRLNDPYGYQDKLIFPGSDFEFTANVDNWLEIHTFEYVTACLAEKISVLKLAA